jgi:hypothetical protein
VSAAAFAQHSISPGADRNRKRWSGDEGPKPHRLMLLWNGVKFMLPHDAMGESAFGVGLSRDERWISPILPVTTMSCSIS